MLDNIPACDQSRRKRARHQEASGIAWMADTDMTEGIKNTLIDENAIGGDKII